MRTLLTLGLCIVLNFSFSQVEINYSTVFEKGTKLINDLSFKLNINIDSTETATSFTFQEIIQDSIFSNTIQLTVAKTQPVFKAGHIGVLYHCYDSNNKGYFIYMMDDYCVINYLTDGKTKFSESTTKYTLMGGK